MNDITCESIKEKILLGEELTDAEKEHIEHCEECRAASLQTEKMINDLGKLSVPVIHDGCIADRVMKEIRDSKVLWFPKSRFSNHVGTVAALAVIVAMFAAVKFSGNVKFEANTTTDTSGLGENVKWSENYGGAVTGAEEPEESSSENTARFLMLDEVKEKTSATSDDAVNSYAYEEGAPQIMYAARGTSSEEKSFESTNAVETEAEVDEISEGGSLKNSQVMFTNGASGGSASAIMDYGEEIFEEKVSVEAEEEETAEMLFSPDLFDENNTLYENVDAANEYVKSIYENANILKAETLSEMQITNKIFLEWITTVETVGEYTFEMLYSYVQNN